MDGYGEENKTLVPIAVRTPSRTVYREVAIMTTLSRRHNPGKQFSCQKYEFVYLFLVWHRRDNTMTPTRAALGGGGDYDDDAAAADDDDTQYMEMKICDKNQIRHGSKTWTAVTGSSRETTKTKILVEKPKLRGQLQFVGQY
jgi:hypothetical protein